MEVTKILMEASRNASISNKMNQENQKCLHQWLLEWLWMPNHAQMTFVSLKVNLLMILFWRVA